MDPLQQARQWIRDASRIAALTGAGISAESGIPTFRGAGGLWREYRAEDLATPQAFARDPELVWEWYAWRRGIIAQAQPNAGHRALAELESHTKNFTLITQNVDGLHRRAGSRSVLEVHGNIWNVRCTACGKRWDDPSVPLAIPPKCSCGGLARPGVVWFGEGLPHEVWTAAEQAAQNCEVFLVIGTSAVVYPAAGLVPLAKESGARAIEVNIDATAVSGIVDLALTGPSAEILPRLLP